MNCLSQMIAYALEQIGLYEPEISSDEATERLSQEGKIWKQFQANRNEMWYNFQSDHPIIGPYHPLTKRWITHLQNENIQKGIAVDLGCGINPTIFNLLRDGWKVYAIDNSPDVIQTLKKRGKEWVENGQLVLINQSIEEFKYPEKVQLILAIDSLPYSNPEKIKEIFLEAKSALEPQGVLVCTLFPYSHTPGANDLMRSVFGGWLTTKNVIEAVVKSVDFSSCSVSKEWSPSGISRQFHIIAKEL